MVSASIDRLSPTRVKLTITVPPAELDPSIKHAYKHIASQVNIPGFRKGKIPAPVIDQRVGRAEVLNQALSEGMDRFFREAADHTQVIPLGRPDAEITTWPSEKDFSGDLVFTVEVDVRPDFTLPEYNDIAIEVEAVTIGVDEVEKELDHLRERFGTLITVDRPAKIGDFAQLDLSATIGEKEIDTASNVSYEIGSGELLDGIDEALESLSAGESTTFTSKLVGGEHKDEEALVAVTLLAVQERELAEADDDFAQIASEFDTIGELRTDIRKRLEIFAKNTKIVAAREKLVSILLEKADIPVPQSVIEDEVQRHLERENRLEDDEHRAEVTKKSEETLRSQFLLDKISQAEQVSLSQYELSSYLFQVAQSYQINPSEFVQMVSENGQLRGYAAEATRDKTLSLVLSKARVTDTNGEIIDVSSILAPMPNSDADSSSPIIEPLPDQSAEDHTH